MNTSSNHPILKQNLFNQCVTGKTGTTILSTINNKSCQIVINCGIVSAISFGTEKGDAALLALLGSTLKGGSFMENATLPMKESAAVQSSSKFLAALGIKKEDITSLTTLTPNIQPAAEESQTVENNDPSVSVRSYRGQVIEVVQPPQTVATEEASPAIPVPKKKVLMYRGQVIDD